MEMFLSVFLIMGFMGLAVERSGGSYPTPAPVELPREIKKVTVETYKVEVRKAGERTWTETR